MVYAMPIYPKLKTVFQHPAHMLAFGFGSGLIRPAPGTWGTVSGVAVFALLIWLGATVNILVLSCVILAIVGTYAADVSARLLNTHDHPGIVVDEWLGVWLVLICVPQHWLHWVVAFLLFRVFDIIKPPPIGWIDRKVHGGVGIMLDDVIAALFALCGWFFVASLGVLP